VGADTAGGKNGHTCMCVCAYVYPHNSWQFEEERPGMGWLRLVGSLKLQVSFAEEPYKRDDILQKRPIILRVLIQLEDRMGIFTYGVATVSRIDKIIGLFCRISSFL